MAQSVKNFGRQVQPQLSNPSFPATYIPTGILRECADSSTLPPPERGLSSQTFLAYQQPSLNKNFAPPRTSAKIRRAIALPIRTCWQWQESPLHDSNPQNPRSLA